MSKRHKHADLIVAWSEGAQIQVKNNQFSQAADWLDVGQPTWDAEKCGEFIAKLEANEAADQRNIALGKTNLQQGFMWATRGVARPTTF